MAVPAKKRRHVWAIVAGVLLVAAAAVFTVSRLILSPSQSSQASDGKAGMSVKYNRSGRKLKSVHITVNPTFPNAKIHIEVLRSGGSSGSTSTAGETVVYKKQVSAKNTPAGTTSTWSGTLAPSDWDGGCRPGVYWIYENAVSTSASLTNGNNTDSQSETSDRFRCG